MEITIPEDCGNSPRMEIVSQVSVEWAERKTDALHARLADGFQWTFVGAGDDPSGHTGGAIPDLPGAVESIEILTAISHGKTAACEGIMHIENKRVDFCHIFRFSGAAKSAKIAEVRTFLISR